MPGVPGTDLIVVESDLVFASPETFLDWPARAGHVDDFAESRVVGVVAVVERKFTVVDGAADHVLVVGGGVDEYPIIDPGSF